MQRPTPWQSYRRIATETATPGQLVLMLYDGAVCFLEKARLGFGEDDPLEFHQTIHNNVLRAQEIIRELNYALDMKQGGQLSATLRRLYEYMDQRLHESNQQKTEPGICDVIKRLTVLRDAWAEMLRKQDQQSADQVSLSAAA
jgi:flagellar secretion chaperone FliS